MKKSLFVLLLAVALGACSTETTTPPPGNRPSIASFTANPATITAGGSSQLSWSVTGATSVSIDQNIGTVDATGTTTVSPAATTTYTLTATNNNGTTTSTATISVTSDPGGEGITKLGTVLLDERTTPGTSGTFVSAFGSFLNFSAALEGFDPNDVFAGRLDTCEVGSEEDVDPSPVTPEGDFSFVGVGDTITFNAAAGPYATLAKTEASFGGMSFIIYTSDPETSLPTPAPAGLTLSVPGSVDFPAFTNVPLPSVASFALTAPVSPENITSDTAFTWTAASGDAVVVIEVSSIDPTTFEFVTVSCIARDDGSFTFPAETKTELGATFSGTLDSIGRQSIEIVTQDDTVLALVAASTVSFSEEE